MIKNLKRKDRLKKGLLKLGEVAAKTGTLPSTIRYYSNLELLKVHDYTPGKYRLFKEDDTLAKMNRIKELKSKGFTLTRIRKKLNKMTDVRKSKLRIDERKAQRFNIPSQMKYRLIGKGGPWEKVQCNNISGGGIGLFVNKPLRGRDKIEVLLYLEGNPKPISTLCSVVWCEKIERDKFRVGLKFIKMKDHSQFINYLCEKMLKLSSGGQ